MQPLGLLGTAENNQVRQTHLNLLIFENGWMILQILVYVGRQKPGNFRTHAMLKQDMSLET